MVDALRNAGKRLLDIPMQVLADVHDATDAELLRIMSGKRARKVAENRKGKRQRDPDEIASQCHLLTAPGKPMKRLRKTYLHAHATLDLLLHGTYNIDFSFDKQVETQGETHREDAAADQDAPT